MAKKIKAAMEEKGVTPDEKTYGSIIIALAKKKNPLEVELLFMEMRSRGLETGLFVWRYVVETFIRTDQLDKAFILVDQMLLEGVKIKGALKNILLTHCRRKNELPWYTKRFGEVPENESFSLKGKRTKGSKINQYEKILEDPRLDWALDGEPLSIVSEAKKKREAEDLSYEEHLRSLEKQFLTIPLKPDHREAMLGSQKEFAKQKRDAKKIPQPKKKKLVKKVDKGEKGKSLKRKKKKKIADKDTTRPRAQFNFKL